MSEIKWQRGERLAPPANFQVQATRLTDRYNLYFDYTHGYLKQVSRPGDPSPTVYYRLVPQQQRRRPRWVRPLRFTLAVVALASLVLVLYPFYPAAQYQVEKRVSNTIGHTQAEAAEVAAAPPIVSNDNRVIIPKIGVNAAILEGSSLAVLNNQEGVWHQTGTLQTGNFVLAGHRWKYLPPNTTTLYNLGELAPGDSIIVDWYRTRYVYTVDKVETVPISQVSILDQNGGPRLTIYTCKNYAQTYRIVVLAHMVP